MAILRNTIQNNSRGHTGAVVYFSRFGKQMQRSFPNHYRDKNSALQQDQRYAKFKPTLEFCKQIKSFAKSFYQVQPQGKSAFSMLMHQLSVAFYGSVLAPSYSPNLSLCGSGDIVKGYSSTIVKATTSSITVTFPTEHPGPFDNADDTISFLISDMEGKNVFFKTTAATRSSGTTTFGVPGILVGSEVQVSTPIFRSADGLLCSPFLLGDDNSPVDLS